MPYKYIVVFIVPEPASNIVCSLMDEIVAFTGLAPPYESMPAHV